MSPLRSWDEVFPTPPHLQKVTKTPPKSYEGRVAAAQAEARTQFDRLDVELIDAEGELCLVDIGGELQCFNVYDNSWCPANKPTWYRSNGPADFVARVRAFQGRWRSNSVPSPLSNQSDTTNVRVRLTPKPQKKGEAGRELRSRWAI